MRRFSPPPLDRRAAITVLALVLAGLGLVGEARAFCGFYVAKADTRLFNQASRVVLVRDGDRTVLTMANDYRGEPSEFAVVIPVPTPITRDQVHVAEPALVDHLDAYTAPRLVEYFDADPCARPMPMLEKASGNDLRALGYAGDAAAEAKSLGVKIEARYDVGEYDVLILSAEHSQGLATWLRGNGYRLPNGAEDVLASYLRQGMRFFVAKVDLAEQARQGFTTLRPLQIAYESPKFMLPIRLGTVNAEGPQELFIFALTRSGRVETTNYRTIKLPSDVELPETVQETFGDFYRAMFDHQVEKERQRAVFLEYAWDMAWCDPCAADPLSPEELRQLGVFWQEIPQPVFRGQGPRPGRPIVAPSPNVFVSRLHLRYTADSFPEDLRFQATGDRSNFQGRYILHHPWRGEPNSCAAARPYFEQLAERQQRWAQNLANLTGWPVEDIPTPGMPTADDIPWWKKLWGG